MIKLYDITDKIYSSNGDKIILPLKTKIHKEDNGDFYLNLETSLSYIKDLVSNRILVANISQEEQAFRITNVEKYKNKNKSKSILCIL